MISEPDSWFLFFFPSTSLPWLNRIPGLRFKHVMAIGFASGLNCWVIYNVHWLGVDILIVSRETLNEKISDLASGATVVRIKRKSDTMPIWSRFGFYCVPAMKHLIGLRCVALTPDGLYRKVLLSGGEIVFGCEGATIATGPDPASASAAG